MIGAERAESIEIMRQLYAAFNRLGVRYWPSDANFVLARVPDAPRTFEGLKARGILVKTLHGSHPLLAHCLRLSVGTPGEIEKLIEALASVLGPHHA